MLLKDALVEVELRHLDQPVEVVVIVVAVIVKGVELLQFERVGKQFFLEVVFLTFILNRRHNLANRTFLNLDELRPRLEADGGSIREEGLELAFLLQTPDAGLELEGQYLRKTMVERNQVQILDVLVC